MPYPYNELHLCPNLDSVGNGICNPENDNSICNFDGRDCCLGSISWIGDGYCDDITNTPQCNFDGGDCCLNSVVTSFCSVCECIENDQTDTVSPCSTSISVGNGLCNPENNIPICNYDGGDCCPNSNLIGDSQCDYINFNHVCQFDGGDCCYKNYNHSLGVLRVRNF